MAMSHLKTALAKVILYVVIFDLCVPMFVPPLAAAQQDVDTPARKIMERVAPSYPELARLTEVKGVVRLEVLVSPSGTARAVRTLSGNPVLSQAAEKAVQKWRWAPAARESSELVEVRFNQRAAH